MKCIEIIRMVSENILFLSEKGASPKDVVTPILSDLSRYRVFLYALRDGELLDESGWRRRIWMVRVACPEVLRTGRCSGCLTCPDWNVWPVHVNGEYEGLSGLCLSKRARNPDSYLTGGIL